MNFYDWAQKAVVVPTSTTQRLRRDQKLAPVLLIAGVDLDSCRRAKAVFGRYTARRLCLPGTPQECIYTRRSFREYRPGERPRSGTMSTTLSSHAGGADGEWRMVVTTCSTDRRFMQKTYLASRKTELIDIVFIVCSLAGRELLRRALTASPWPTDASAGLLRRAAHARDGPAPVVGPTIAQPDLSDDRPCAGRLTSPYGC